MVWDHGKITDLSTLPGASSGDSGATSINDNGRIVGWSSTSTGGKHAVVWDKGKITDLGTLPGAIPDESSAAGINGRGQIVGYSYMSTG